MMATAICNNSTIETQMAALTSPFSPPDVARYARQLVCPAWGAAAQVSLSSVRVLLVGAGGLGCPAALYLSGAGVGALTIVDDGLVAISDLARQVAFATSSVGTPKADALAAACVARCGSRCAVSAVRARALSNTVAKLLRGHHVVVDASDNAATRYLLSDACVLSDAHRGGAASTAVPLVSGAALGVAGQVGVYAWRGGPCYRCAFPASPPPEALVPCSDAGVLGPVTGLVGCLLALEVLKIAAAWAIDSRDMPVWSVWEREARPHSPRAKTPEQALGQLSQHSTPLVHVPSLGPPLSHSLLCIDAGDAVFRRIALKGHRAECATCGDAPTIKSLDAACTWSAIAGLPHCEGACLAVVSASIVARHVEADSPLSIPASLLVAHMQRSGSYAHEVLSRVLDVRDACQRDIYALPGSAHLPFARLLQAACRTKDKSNGAAIYSAGDDSPIALVTAALAAVSKAARVACANEHADDCYDCRNGRSCKSTSSPDPLPIVESRSRSVPLDALLVLCRRGSDALHAVHLLRAAALVHLNGADRSSASMDHVAALCARALCIEGGIAAWASALGSDSATIE